MEKSGSKLVPFVQGLSHQLQLFLLEYNSQYSVGQFPGYNHQAHGARLDIDRQQRQMMDLCGRLREAVAGGTSRGGMTDDREVERLVEMVTDLGAGFTRLVELMLGLQIQVRH